MAAIDLDKDQWQRLKGVLTDALKLPSAERLDMLNRRLAGDPTLRQRAIEMLGYYDKATKPFGNTATQSETLGNPLQRPPQPQLIAGEVVGNYRIVRKLGQGGMGVVYLAQDERLGRQVALKFLFPSIRGKLIDANGHLLSESRSAAALNHPGIVTFHDIFEHRRELVAVMEYVEGRPLSELIAGEPLPLGFALRLAGQLADALSYAHARGIIHCDLKPANIHVLPNGATKILDFGIARAAAGSSDGTDSRDAPLFGTAGYLSPERLLGRPATASADVYALGIVVYQLLTGVPPFRTDDDAQLFLDTLTATPLAPSTLVGGIPSEVDHAVLRCLSKNARERLQPHELLRALNNVLRDLETAPVPVLGASSGGITTSQKTDTQAVTTGQVAVPAPRNVFGRAVAVLGGIAVALTVCGLITSMTYNGPLGLVGRFANESALLWPVWGVRSLIAVIGELLIFSIAILIVTGISRLVYATVGPFRRLCDPIITRARRAMERIQATPIAMLAPALLLLQLVVFALLLWRFQPIVSGLDGFLMRRSPALFWGLGPQNRPDQNLLTELLSANVLIFGAAWYQLFKRSREHEEGDGRAAIWAGVAMLGFSVIIFQVALFRVIYHNEAERVTYRSDRCYIVGQGLNEALLFCPGRTSPPFDQIVDIGDPALKRDGSFENIFAVVGPQD